MELYRDTHIAFIGLDKALDNIHWKKLFQIIKDKHLDWKDRIILNLYNNQMTIMDIRTKQELEMVYNKHVLSPHICLVSLFKME